MMPIENRLIANTLKNIVNIFFIITSSVSFFGQKNFGHKPNLLISITSQEANLNYYSHFKKNVIKRNITFIDRSFVQLSSILILFFYKHLIL